MLLIARTDSESGKLISSNVDVTDHEFILGTTTKGTPPLAQALADAEVKGATGADIDHLEKEWTASHEMCTFNQGKATRSLMILFDRHLAVDKAIQRSDITDKDGALKTYLSAVDGKANNVARAVATDILGEEVFWDWDGTSFSTLPDGPVLIHM